MLHNDTILAISSPPAPAPRAILRLSGPRPTPSPSPYSPHPPTPHSALSPHPSSLRPYSVLSPQSSSLLPPSSPVPPSSLARLPALLLLFSAPRSFTGLDTAELHLPGSPALLRLLSAQLLAAGARQAEPGEFTAQAFFHNKMDLTQAEGIAATIAATTNRQLRAAASLRDGALHKWTAATADRLAHLLALLEAGIDFSDESDVSFISPADIRTHLNSLISDLDSLTQNALRWERLDSLPTVLLTGRPNVGKSSLLNALSASDRAIVSPTAGTTRDQLSAIMNTSLGPVRLLDIAGTEAPTDDLRAKMNEVRARALHEADLILLVTDPADTSTDIHTATHALAAATSAPILVIINKIDLITAKNPAFYENKVPISAKKGQNLDVLRHEITRRLTLQESAAPAHFTLNRRHLAALRLTQSSLAHALQNTSDHLVQHSPELLASDLRLALDSLGQISGAIAPDDILGRIFGTFCIGK